MGVGVFGSFVFLVFGRWAEFFFLLLALRWFIAKSIDVLFYI